MEDLSSYSTASYSTEFVDWARQRGGVWVSPDEPDVFDLAVAKEAAALRQTAAQWTASAHGIAAEAGVVANEEVNASVALVNGRYFVAINGAMIVYLYGECRTAIGPMERPLSAENKGRYSITAHAAVSVARFHEFGHIVNGHLDLWQSRLGNNALAERRIRSGLSGVDEQTLEFDADCYAAQELFVQLAGAETDGRRGDGSQIWRWPKSNRFGDQAQQMSILGAAMYLYVDTIVKMRGGRKLGWENDFALVAQDTHPPLETRIHSMLATVATFLQKFGFSDEERQKAIRLMTDSVVETATNLGQREKRLQELVAKPIGPAHEYNKMLEKNWEAKIRPALEPFARRRLAGSPFNPTRHK